MNTNSDTKNLPPKKLKSYNLKSFRLFSKNLKPKTPPHRRASYNPASSAGRLQPSPHNLPPTTYHLQPSRGFTLVELLVTLSLFVVITTIVLFSQSKFNGSILLTNLAYDVALTVRQAQTFGINVREASDSSFKHAYGVHFDKDKTAEFILFADSVGNDNHKYDGDSDCASSPECVNKYNIKRGNKISKICVTSGGADHCSDSSALGKLDITFLRPDPDAIIKGDSYSDAAEAKITISSADGNTRNIVVNSTGQISIGRGL